MSRLVCDNCDGQCSTDMGNTVCYRCLGTGFTTPQLLAITDAPPPAVPVDAIGLVEGLRAELRKFAVQMEYDCPGDVPETCGMWCVLCKNHVSDDGVTGHREECLCAETTEAISKASGGAK